MKSKHIFYTVVIVFVLGFISEHFRLSLRQGLDLLQNRNIDVSEFFSESFMNKTIAKSVANLVYIGIFIFLATYLNPRSPKFPFYFLLSLLSFSTVYNIATVWGLFNQTTVEQDIVARFYILSFTAYIIFTIYVNNEYKLKLGMFGKAFLANLLMNTVLAGLFINDHIILNPNASTSDTSFELFFFALYASLHFLTIAAFILGVAFLFKYSSFIEDIALRKAERDA